MNRPANNAADASTPRAGNSSTKPVTLLINYITKHQLPVFELLHQRFPALRILVSVDIEPQRDYRADFGILNVVRQRNITLRSKWKHDVGFEDHLYVHVPWDTFWRLLWQRPRVILSYELGARSIMSALYRSLFRKSRLVLVLNVSEHTEKSWGRWRRLVRPWLLRTADVVTYNGPSCKNYLQAFGLPEEKLIHLPYAAHPESVDHGPTSRPPSQRHRLIWVGQLSQRKNPMLLLEQLAEWARRHPDREIALSMVGRGPLQSAIEAFSRPANFRLEMLGIIDPIAMPAVWAEHGVMVFPTLADEWGMVVNEAMHSGLPVLGSSYAQSSLACIEEDVTGWLFSPKDASAMYAAIDKMMQCSCERLDQMAEAARQRVAFRTPEYSAEAFSAAIEAALR